MLAREYDETDKRPVANSKEIRFNGKDDDGHETFLLKPAAADFSFCKTAQKPYDTAVCAVLIAAKVHAGESFGISSDGDVRDWEQGLDIYNRACSGSVSASQLETWLNNR